VFRFSCSLCFSFLEVVPLFPFVRCLALLLLCCVPACLSWEKAGVACRCPGDAHRPLCAQLCCCSCSCRSTWLSRGGALVAVVIISPRPVPRQCWTSCAPLWWASSGPPSSLRQENLLFCFLFLAFVVRCSFLFLMLCCSQSCCSVLGVSSWANLCPVVTPVIALPCFLGLLLSSFCCLLLLPTGAAL
jgi:hypothetical protein